MKIALIESLREYRKAHNLTAGLSDGRLRAVQGIARASGQSPCS